MKIIHQENQIKYKLDPKYLKQLIQQIPKAVLVSWNNRISNKKKRKQITKGFLFMSPRARLNQIPSEHYDTKFCVTFWKFF